MTNLPAVISADALVIRQRKEMAEVFTSIETSNSYVIQLPNGSTVLDVAETGDSAMAFLVRNFLKNRRPFRMAVSAPGGHAVLQLHRPWRWLFSRLDVHDGGGQPLGAIQQRFAVFAKRFAVLDAGGQELAELHGPVFRPWTFNVVVNGQTVGSITKEWSGLLREAFTDADTFGVQFGPGMSPQLRSLALAATFLIDFLYFERSD